MTRSYKATIEIWLELERGAVWLKADGADRTRQVWLTDVPVDADLGEIATDDIIDAYLVDGLMKGIEVLHVKGVRRG